MYNAIETRLFKSRPSTYTPTNSDSSMQHAQKHYCGVILDCHSGVDVQHEHQIDQDISTVMEYINNGERRTIRKIRKHNPSDQTSLLEVLHMCPSRRYPLHEEKMQVVYSHTQTCGTELTHAKDSTGITRSLIIWTFRRSSHDTESRVNLLLGRHEQGNHGIL